jgi:uncharacterized OB-fold protein
MPEISIEPDLRSVEIPMDSWTQPFWDGTAEGKLLAPRCSACHRFRWPPGPFCPHCQSQLTEWIAAGEARIYSFTIVHNRQPDGTLQVCVPALIEFPETDGIRLLAAIVNTPVSVIQIGANAVLGWSQAANARIPVFSIPKSTH